MLILFTNKKKWILLFLLFNVLFFIQCQERENIEKDRCFIYVNKNQKIYIGQRIEDVKKIMGNPLKNEMLLDDPGTENNDVYKMIYEGLEIIYLPKLNIVESIHIDSKYCFLDICIGDSLNSLKQKMSNYSVEYEVNDESGHEITYYYGKFKIYENYLDRIDITFVISQNNKIEKIIIRSSDYLP